MKTHGRAIRMIITLALACAMPRVGAAQESPRRTPPDMPVAHHTLFLAPTSQTGYLKITLVATRTGTPPTLFRRSSAEPRTMILLNPTTTTPAQLSGAVLALLAAEANDPHGRTRSDHAASRVRVAQGETNFSWAADALRRLERAAPQSIAGFADARALSIWVPLQR